VKAISEKGFSVRLTANVDSYVAAMAKARGATETMSSASAANMVKVGGQMQKLGGQMSRYVTLPVVGAGVAAIKMSSDFESAFARMQGLAGVTADEVDGLKASVLDLAGRTAQAPQALADALYQASSSGLNTADAMAAVEVAAKGAAAGMGSAADIVGLVASAVASYGKANITAARATDILTSAIREGRADPAELAGTLGRVLPIANAVGICFEEVGGATAYLSNIMGDTNRSVTSLQGLLVKLASPTAQGRQALADMGTSVTELKAAIDQDGLLGALDLLKTHGFEGNSQAMTQLFDDIEGRQGALALMADESGTLAATMDKVANSAGSLDQAFTVAADTSGFKMKQAWTDIQVALIKAGDVIMPIVSNVAGAIAGLAETFSSMPAPVQAIVIAFLGLVAAAGPLLVVGGSLIKNFNLMKTTFTGTGAKISAGFGLMAVAGTAALYLLNSHLEEVARTKAFDKARIDLFIQGLKDGASAADTLNNALSSTDELTFIDPSSGNVASFADELSRAGITFDDFQKHLHGTKEEFQAWVSTAGVFGKDAGVEGSRLKLDDINHLYNAGIQIIDQYSAAVQQNTDETFAHGKTLDGERHGLDSVKTATEDLTKAKGELADVPPPTADEVAAIQAVTDAVNRQAKAFQDDLDAQMALIDFARRAADAQYALAASTDDYNRFLEELPDKLKEINKSKDSEAEKLRQVNALYRDGSGLAAKLADDVVTAYDDAANGAMTAKDKGDLWRNSMLTSAAAAAGPVRQSILDYVLAVNKVPEEKKTAIIAAVEAGDLATAVALLDGASMTRTAEIHADADQKSVDKAQGKLDGLQDPLHAKLIVTADTSGANAQIRLMLARVGVLNYSASGRFVDHPMISMLGEGGRPEVVLPLSNAARMSALLSDSRVSGPILSALGGVGSAEGRTVNLTHMSIPSTSAGPTASVIEAVTSAIVLSGNIAEDAQREAEAATAAQDKLMQRMFQRDALSYAQYHDYLAKRKEGMVQYSDDEQALFDQIQQLDQNEARARERDAQIQTDMADRIQKYLADTNQISLADYQAYLSGRRDSYQVYTDQWFALTNQIAEAQRQIDQAAATATQAVFKQADAVKTLADATQANQEAAAAFNEAGVKVMTTAADRNATQQDRDTAAADYERSAVNLAATAYNIADAIANDRGLLDGSVEWARFMRERLTADSVWNHANGRDNVANAVDRLLLGIPAFAAGGYVPATPGGRIIRVAEGGQGEYMTPANRMHAMSGGGQGSVYAPTYNISIGGAIDRPGVAREIREILDEDNRRNGRV
jgi:TP901 family phage tail tape measure protein